MSFGGHVYDMNQRLRQNRALAQARRDRTNSVRQKLFDMPKKHIEHRKKLKSYPPEYRAKLQKRLIVIKKREIRNQIITLLVTTLLVSGIIIYLMKTFMF